MDGWHLIYNYWETPPFQRIYILVIPLIIIGVGLLMFKFYRNHYDPRRVHPFYRWGQLGRNGGMVLGIFFVSIGVLGTAATVFGYIQDHTKSLADYENRECEPIEGRVEHCHVDEWFQRFEVEGVSFYILKYSKELIGYNLHPREGGVIREGLCVRICYRALKNQNAILRLEIED